MVGEGHYHVAGAVPYERNLEVEGDPAIGLIAAASFKGEIGFGVC